MLLLWIVILILLGFWYYFREKKEKFSPKIKVISPPGNDFFIYNYLLKPIKVDFAGLKGELSPALSYIAPRSRSGLKSSVVVQHLRDGMKFRISVLDLPDSPRWYSDYELDLPADATIKALHVGMITSRWVGATQDSTFIPALNAVQGRPWIKIHNTTGLNLHINNNIDISSYGTLRYSGRDHFGVRIGTIFTDQEGIFPPYKFKQPATDVYWGVVSDLQQPFFGGWQIDSEFDDSADDPQWLLENGWYGGPAEGNISPGFIPKDGPATPPLDRWGRLPNIPIIKSAEADLNKVLEDQPQMMKELSGV